MRRRTLGLSVVTLANNYNKEVAALSDLVNLSFQKGEVIFYLNHFLGHFERDTHVAEKRDFVENY